MLEYTNKVCLAPMVRTGELPMRLLSLQYGCDLVWSPELIDKKLITSERKVNAKLGTIDFVTPNKHIKKKEQSPKQQQEEEEVIIFRKHPNETGKLILQLGTSSPDLAVEAARKVIDDVEGIDLNCGCPKSFSTHSGMGAELLKTPDLLCSILTNLVNRIGKPNNKPISCKIRLLPNYEATFALVEKICQTGISNLTIHCRTPIMRNRQDPIWNYLPRLIPMIQGFGVSVILNGNFQGKQDLANLQKAMKNEKISIMIGEAAEANPSIFSSSSSSSSSFPITQAQSISQIFKLSEKYGNFPNTKYVILNMIVGKSKYFTSLAQSKSFDQMRMVIAEIDKETKKIEDGEVIKDRVFSIMNRNCQRAQFWSQEEYNRNMEQRGVEMAQYFEQWDEKTMLADLYDTVTPRKRQASDKHKKKEINEESQIKRQKIEVN
ncbi:SMM1 [Candida oxycetoniae]|uniref:SMM1 n=1 Tax=Candida oxycetoniae TaxID=497107 RepID=A0AAI9WXW6_9ASCO|nr:SMM1 [Candida oxycetoniae]KAI3404499.2 SMM1 [Candida oxycetoniae]